MKKKILFMFLPALMAISVGTTLPTAVFASEGNSENTKELFNPDSAGVDHTWGQFEDPEATWDKASQTLTIEIKVQGEWQWANQVFLSTGITTLDTSKEYQFSFTATASTDDCGGVTFMAFDSNILASSYQNLPFTTTPYNYVSEWATPSVASTNGYIVFDFGWDAPQTVTITNISIKERSKVVSYTISNGTPESAKETNHGYITIDKETAAESETVQITAKPNEGYQLKSLTATPVAPTIDGAVKGVFSIDATKKVNFSQGNLTYNVTDTKWAFYEHQYDRATDYDSNLISLFTWGYGTWSTSPNGTDYQTGDFTDWGSQIGDGNTWRTLSTEEWQYLFDTRIVNGGTKEGKSYQRATINSDTTSVYGVILYPDNYTSQTDATSYTSTKWTTMEENGCVFLPAAGYRSSSHVLNAGNSGYYWSSTENRSSRADNVLFNSYSLTPNDYMNRLNGGSVRLVTSAPADPETITPEKQQDGTYTFTMPAANVTVTAEFEKQLTIADILTTVEGGFPSSSDGNAPSNAWVNSNNEKMFSYEGDLYVGGESDGDFVLSENTKLTKDGNNYKCTKDGATVTFIMDDGALISISIEGLTDDAKLNGTYTAPAVWPADAPTEAPAAPTYDGVSLLGAPLTTNLEFEPLDWPGSMPEKLTFETGETIYYMEKMNWQIYTNWAEDSYDMSEYDTLHVDLFPAADTRIIVEIEGLSSDDGGQGYKNSVEKTLTAGEWNGLDIALSEFPALSSGEIYDFTDVRYFTLVGDYDNQTALSVGNVYFYKAPHEHAIKTTHTKVEAKCVEAGHETYYECSCGKYFSDQALTQEIENLETWLGENGDGYIAPIGHDIGKVNGTPATEGADGFKDAYKCNNCGQYFEDAEGTKLIGDETAYNAWKLAEGKIPALDPQKENGLSGGAIAGIVIGSVFGLLIIAFVVLYILWKRKNLNVPILSKVLTPAFRFINKLFFKTKLNDVEAKEAENKAMKE